MGAACWAVIAAAGAMVITGETTAQGTASAPPTARYFMDAATSSNSMPMASMMPGGGQARELTLRLGSRLAPTGGEAKADHFMPAAMRLGASVPLVSPTPATQSGTPATTKPDAFKLPKARLLIFWGCGAHAGPGQPVVIDFSHLAAGKAPPSLYTANVPVESGPTLASSRTFGDWPNASNGRPTSVNRSASLIGDHRITGNYSPEIRFALAQDFMPALKVQSSAAGDGSTAMSWNPVAGATGYYAMVMGGKSMGEDTADMVWWTSSATREFGGGLQDWLSPATVSRLVGQRIAMPASQTNCTVPAEVKRAAGGPLVGFMTAYGPEQDFAYPPRPANPRAAWRPDWTVTARFKSSTTMMLGMPSMDSAMQGGGGEASQGPAPARKCRPSLGGMLGALAGARIC